MMNLATWRILVTLHFFVLCFSFLMGNIIFVKMQQIFNDISDMDYK